MNRTKFIVQAAIIGSIYVVLTLAFAPISFGAELFQLRISEALTVLPFLTPAAIPGLFIGCMIANLFSPVGAIDVVAGSLATLIAACLTYYMPKKILAPMPPVVVNGLVIGTMLHAVYDFPLIIAILSVTLGQLAACYGLGYPLLLVLDKYKRRIFD